MSLLRALIFLVALVLAVPAAAQDYATITADRVEIRSDTVLVAEGNVRIFWRGSRVSATRMVYDRAADRLTIEGPIVIDDGEGSALFAEEAELSADLRDGILTSARLLLDQQFQLAANEIARVGGRYTVLDKVVASSCQVCPGTPVPLWSIRARRVIHDEVERQIYFEGAQFRVADIPVAYIPRLRLPDPSLKRATGFLFPRIKSSSTLGTGLKIPYFITLGRSADLTLTPYLSAETRTLEARFRRAFRYGDITIGGSVSRDDLRPGETRHYLSVGGLFNLPRDFRLSFNLQDVSDPDYLNDYGYSGTDRLESNIALTRARRDEYIRGEIVGFETLRDFERNETQPRGIVEGVYERRFVPGPLGGTATLSFGALSMTRTSRVDGVGRDVDRLSAALGWERTEVVGPGLLATGAVRVTAQSYGISDDSAFPDNVTRTIPEASASLRWPLSRTDAAGGVQVLEPAVQVAWAPDSPAPVPNEDSVLVELDEANLLSFSRFPGEDARERGTRIAVGAMWTRLAPTGWTARLGFGRIFRDADTGEFGGGSGLEGEASDWLVAGHLDLPGRLQLTGRALFDDALGVSKADLRFGYDGARYDLSSAVTILSASPSENRFEDIAEWSAATAWQLTPFWTGRASWRYDFRADQATHAGLGLGYENECLRVDVSLSRRFASSTRVRGTTDFGLSVELLGFGTGGDGGARRRCVQY